ncbi:hypothetical protein L596_008057 [Steinernema carpocapsae]|uniref:Uncharacterized protein n=1 Tax=Steinernema carpocapsae TaxID=34508 RepID=A0A4U5PBV2_STECR|nr:hypothetical protein L596_008057 [Steinernema carpocapsae]
MSMNWYQDICVPDISVPDTVPDTNQTCALDREARDKRFDAFVISDVLRTPFLVDGSRAGLASQPSRMESRVKSACLFCCKPGAFASEGISQARSFAFLAAFVQRAVKKQKSRRYLMTNICETL